ncbi:MAG: PEP/pyruvate-binding domain-containing protein [Anaerolineae bacterium]
MTAMWLKSLDDIDGSDLPLVGGKTFALATLRRHGLPVPEGLVVTTAFFEEHLRQHQFIPIWAGSPDVAVTEGALHWLGDVLKISPLSSELTAALHQELANTFPGVESFVVRSSAIDEDARQHSFSGIHLSELGVPRQMIPISLSRCWASAFSKPALEYRRKHNIPIQSIRLAVLIQPYIQSTVAGVAFTINPLSGSRDEMVIEAAYGHGSAVASGQVTPARYQVTKRPPDYALLDWTPGRIQPTATSAVAQQPAATVSDERGPLSTSQLQKLAQYLEHIEALMGAPQDVEWAISADKAFFFFQSRPITSLSTNAVPFGVEWSRADYREYFPDLPSPLCATLLERSQDWALTFLEQSGFNVDRAGPFLKLILGRPYLNLTLARHLLSQIGLNPDSILWLVGHSQLASSPDPAYRPDWQRLWKERRPIARLLWRGLRAGAELDRFKGLVEDMRHSLSITDWATASPASLLSRFRLRTQLSSRLMEVDFVLLAASVAVYSLILLIAGPLSRQVEQLARRTITSAIQTRDAPQRGQLLELARIARSNEKTRSYLASPGQEFTDYRQALAGTPFLAAFDEFMSHYGRSAPFEADPGWPRYDEDPPSLLASVAQMAKVQALPERQAASSGNHLAEKPSDGSGEPDDQGQAGRYKARGLERILPWRRWLVNLSLRRLQSLAHMRVRLRALYGQAMGDCRSWDLKLAERWVAKGWLAAPQDYYWLTMEETERALVAEGEVGAAIPALVRARREVYQSYATTEMPYSLQESDVTRLVPGRGLVGTALSSVLSGLPVSPGQVRGKTIVLRRPEEAARMPEGAILVAPSTESAWFSVFPKARGLIVETGGLLSHGSIITREFGLPTVADIPDATSRFQDGDLVLLDGSTGLVQILAPATAESAPRESQSGPQQEAPGSG